MIGDEDTTMRSTMSLEAIEEAADAVVSTLAKEDDAFIELRLRKTPDGAWWIDEVDDEGLLEDGDEVIELSNARVVAFLRALANSLDGELSR